MKCAIFAAVVCAAGIAAAAPDPILARIESRLPTGWSLLATDTELVFRHDRPCYRKDEQAPNGPLMTLELRYKLEPKWSDKQLADAQAKNTKLAAELAALRTRYRIDAIHAAAGKPQPANADERARLAAFAKGEAAVRTHMVRVPRCSLATSSVFETDDNAAVLATEVDPPEAQAEARRVVEVIDRECAAATAAAR